MRGAWILTALLALSACIVVPVPLPVVTAAPTGAAVAAPQRPVPQGLPGSVPASARFDGLINQFRAQNGRGPLVSNAGLDRVSASYAADLAARGVVQHVDRQGGRATDRVRQAGVATCLAGENLAQGVTSFEEAFAVWLDSPGHRRNMLHRPYVNYGIGRAGDVWVLTMMLPC